MKMGSYTDTYLITPLGGRITSKICAVEDQGGGGGEGGGGGGGWVRAPTAIHTINSWDS